MFNFLFSWLLPTAAKAQALGLIDNIPCVQNGYILPSGQWSPGTCTLDNITAGVGYLINYGVAISGALALLMFIIGGWYLVASAGRKDWITRGKNILINTVFAIFFILGAWLLVRGVLDIVGSNIIFQSGETTTTSCQGEGTQCNVTGKCKVVNNIGECVNPCVYLATDSKPYSCHNSLDECFPAGTACVNYPDNCLETQGLCLSNQYCCFPSAR
ncbi:MAG: pilin [Candidatus Komeilibacteria bacterium]